MTVATATRRLASLAEISEVLSKPSWSVSSLFAKEPASEGLQVPNEDTLEKLLKQSALESTKNDPERRDMLLKELKNQLTFVEHVAGVDTDGVDPLVRIGGPVQEFSLEKALEQSEKAGTASWKPTDLAQEKNGEFYVLHEGLRRE